MRREELLIEAAELRRLMQESQVLVFDCRFDLAHPARGYNSWLAAHVPGAVYADLDKNLSAKVSSRSGRHPIPTTRSFAAFLSRSGWRPDIQIVAYDSQGGMFAARLWWLMNYFGIGNTRVLDGGIGAWMSASYPMEPGVVKTERVASPELVPNREMIVSSQWIADHLEEGMFTLLDARNQTRYEGQQEPIDEVAGHIPGALNLPCEENTQGGKAFKSDAELKARLKSVIGKKQPENIIHMCGSGVTACHNLLAMELAGFSGSRLYPGSWSEWIRDPSRPIVQGRRT